MASIADSRSGEEFLLSRINYERSSAVRPEVLKLDRMVQLLERLGRPDQGLRIVHVAGTKGKGSTCHMVESILRAYGWKTGLYTSPHLEHLGERFRVNGVPATPEVLEEQIRRLRPVALEMDRLDLSPTFFELTTALAFQYFTAEQVDVAVVEVGLGGRLDSTNVCSPLVTAITSISRDHTQTLGNTLREIAGEKAGIVKTAIPLLTSCRQQEVLDRLTEAARSRQAPLYRIGVDFDVVERKSSFAVVVGERCFDGLTLPLHGRHQRENAALAVAICDQVSRQVGGEPLPSAAVHQGLANTSIPARIEVFSRKPLLVVDVAHNEASMRELVSSMFQLEEQAELAGPASRPKRRLVYSSSRDKNNRAILEIAGEYFQEIILTKYQSNPRATRLKALSEWVASACPHCESLVIPDPEQAWEEAIGKTGPKDVLCIAGSFFIAAELLPKVRQHLRD